MIFPALFYPNFLTLMCSLSRQSSLCICKASHIKIGNKDFRGRLTFPTLCISSAPEYVNFLFQPSADQSSEITSVLWKHCMVDHHTPTSFFGIQLPILMNKGLKWWRPFKSNLVWIYMHIVSSNINMFCFLMKVVWPMLWIYSHIKGGGGALSQLDQNINHWICFAWTQKSMQYIFANV